MVQESRMALSGGGALRTPELGSTSYLAPVTFLCVATVFQFSLRSSNMAGESSAEQAGDVGVCTQLSFL